MRFLLLLALLSACRDLSHDPSPDAAPTGPHVRVGTFNVRRFFDTVCETGACSSADYEAVLADGEFAARADQLADAILTLDVDVLALEEIETQACLDALLARLPGHFGALGEIGLAASVDVAVISKTPIDSVTTHRADNPLVLPDGTTTTFSRELLEVAVHALNTKVILFAAHFKAKSADDPPRRLAEAQTAARLVAETAMREPGAIVVLGGDLNDTPESPPLAALSGLVRLADDLPAAEQATYFYQGRGQAIDHLFLAPTPAGLRAPFSTQVYVDRNGNGFGGSDHRALTSELIVP